MNFVLSLVFTVLMLIMNCSCYELFIFRQVELCVKILSDIMELLFRGDIGPTGPDIKEIMLTVLRTVIQTTIAMDRESPLVVSL